MATEKICPIMSGPVFNDFRKALETVFVPCQESKCRFWVQVYSTEGLQQSKECSVVLQALTNADGLFVV
jgi:hypothetical protein